VTSPATHPPGPPPVISVILPVYNEEENLRDLHRAITSQLDGLPMRAEVIYTDDGSTDNSAEVLAELAAEDDRVVALLLGRNYGQTAAMSAAFEAARGEIIISMDADLQNDPTDIPALLRKLDEGYDVVSGWRHRRQDPWLTRRLPSAVANRILGWVTGLHLHDYGCSLKAYRQEFLEDVRLYGEFHRFIPVFAHWQGARVAELKVEHHPRTRGESKYGLGRVFRVSMDLLLLRFMGRYGTRPSHFTGAWASFCALFAALVFAFVAVRALVFGTGWISPAIFVSFFFGGLAVQFLLFGLLAELTIRTYYESQNRRPYRVRKRLGRGASQPEHPDPLTDRP
jgi:glycosyltransferase involved in cell wall biosynthesis